MTTNATANQPESDRNQSTTQSVLAATPALIALNNPPLEAELMTYLLFEDIGGQELINILRNDILETQDLAYNIVTNLKDIRIEYNPNNIIGLENTSDTYFKSFSIKFENKIPSIGSGPNGEIVYLDPLTRDLVINVIGLEPDEQVDVQIVNSGEIFNDTIYGLE
jgi:hypothetical protein